MSAPQRVSDLIRICNLDPSVGPFPDMGAALRQLQAECRAHMDRFGFTEAITIDLIDDPTGVCVVQKGPAGYTILVPWGLFFRVTHMSRLMLPRLQDSFRVNFVESPLDGFSADDHFVPAFLKPALAEYDDAAAYIQAFRTHWDPDVPQNMVGDLAWIRLYAIYQAVLHELGHIVRGHFALRGNTGFTGRLAEAAQILARDARGGIPPLTVNRALEVDADFVQGLLLAESAFGDLLRNGGSGRHIGFTSAFASCVLLSVIDAERRQIASYIKDDHLAPVFRFEVLLKAGSTTLNFIANSPQGRPLMQELHAYGEARVTAHQMFQIALHNLRRERFEEIEDEAAAIRAANPQTRALPAMSGLLVGGPGSATILQPIVDFVQLEYQVVSRLITDACRANKQGLTIDLMSAKAFADMMNQSGKAAPGGA